MEFIIERDALLAPLKHAAAHVEPKSTIPGRNAVAITAEAGGTVTITATDLVRDYRVTVKADVKRPGSVAVVAALLVEQVAAMPAGDLTVTVDAKLKVTLKAARARALLPGIDAEFVTVPAFKGDLESFTAPAPELLAGITATLAAVSEDQTRAHLASLYIGDGLFVSTNGNALHRAAAPITPGRHLLVPRVGVEAWAKALARDKGAATLRADARRERVVLAAEAGEFGVKLTDAAYPSYRQVIPTAQEWSLRASAKALTAALAGMPQSRTSGVRFSLDGDTLVLEGTHDDLARRVEVPVTHVRGRKKVPEAWGLNRDYFAAAITAAVADEVLVEGCGELDPVTVQPVEGSFLAVVMPMRV